MDRRTILAVVLALATFLAWDAWMSWRYPDRNADAAQEQSLPAPIEVAATTPAPVASPIAPVEPAAPEHLVQHVPFEACGTKSEITTDGGLLQDATLLDHQAPYHVSALWSYAWDRVRGVTSEPWKPYGDEPGDEKLLTEDSRVLAMGSGTPGESAFVDPPVEADGALVIRGVTSDGIEVTRYLRPLDTVPCTIGVTTTWRNVGTSAYTGTLWLGLHDVVPESPSRYENAVAPFAMVDGGYEYAKLRKLTAPETHEGPVDWIALSDRYFALVLLPDHETRKGTLAFSRIEQGEHDAFGVHYTIAATLAPGEGHTEQFTMFMGAKDLATLKALDPSLGKLVNFGMFSFFGKILLSMMRFFHTLVGNWGLAIIVLTFTVKAAFFPLTQASFKSSQAMSALQPELQGIREQFKDAPEEMNRRTMELFRQRGVNPLGGCLPMLVQFPVWIALYQVLLNSVELYHTEFLYFRDLSSADPYGALPAVVMVLMVIQQQLTPMPNMDPAQARMMKILPLVFGIFFFTFPSGLVVYIFVNMVLTILQQWFIKRTYQQPAVTVAATT